MELRKYQHTAVQHALADLHRGKNPLLVMPTGAGKSLVIAELCKRLDKQILVITPRIKLLEQNSKLIDGTGILSGSRGSDTGENHRVVCGTYQTLIRRDFKEPEIIIIDEAHLVPDDDSEFAALLNRFSKAQFVGLTATPFRGHAHIYGNIKSRWRKSYEVSLVSLIEKGFLVPPRAFKTGVEVDREHSSNEEVTQEILPVAKSKLKELNRTKTLVFCKSIEHAEYTASELQSCGESSLCIHSEMTLKEQEAVYQKFENSTGHCWLVNCNMLTTGVDLPYIDSIVLLRKIQEGGLYIQIVGRGLRPYEGKDYCAVLDYGKNSSRFGLLDMPKFLNPVDSKGKQFTSVERHCPECELILKPNANECDHCGHIFTIKPTLEINSSDNPLLSIDVRQSHVDSVKVEDSLNGSFKVTYLLKNGESAIRFVAKEKKQQALSERGIVMYRVSKGVSRFHSIR